MKYIKTYGITKGNNKYYVCTGIEKRNGYEYKHIHTNLAYKIKKNAEREAESFIRQCHKNFYRGEELIEFEFVNCGELAWNGF